MNSFEIDTRNFVLKHLGYNRNTKLWECQMFDDKFRLPISGDSPQRAIDSWVHARNNYTNKILAFENEKRRIENERRAAEEAFQRSLQDVDLLAHNALTEYYDAKDDKRNSHT